MIKIEMIGRHNRAGPNRIFVTGSRYSNLENILRTNLTRYPVQPVSEGPDPTGLYTRSDNYSLASRGIPAHYIMCSYDKDTCYHLPCDTPGGIDYSNMTAVVKAIGLGVRSLVSGIEEVEWK